MKSPIKKTIFINPFLVVFLLSLNGCGRESGSKQAYQEIVIESPLKTVWQGTGDPHAFLWKQDRREGETDLVKPSGDRLLDSRSDLPLTWQKPASWQEFPGSGFRLVTFKAGEENDAIECSIVSLSGAAGGIDANLLRWMKQINLELPSEPGRGLYGYEGAPCTQFKTQFRVMSCDFTALQKNQPESTPSMMVNIFNSQDSTIFLKMTGSIKAVKEHAAEFHSLAGTLKLQ